MAAVAGRSDAAVIVSCGFEPAADTWSFAAVGDGTRNTNAGAADSPPNQRIRTGSGSWLVAGSTSSVLTFSEVLLSGWNDVSIAYHVSSTAATDADGHSGGDRVAAYVARTTTDLDHASAAITLQGFAKSSWGYQSGAAQQTTAAGSAGIVCQPSGGGLRTDDGYSSFKIAIPDGTPSVALRIAANSSSPQTFWNLDDIVLSGSPTSSHDCLWTPGDDNTWDNSTTANRWSDQSNGNASCAWNSARGDNARFTQAGFVTTIAPETTVAARSLTFSADGCTIAAGDLASRLVLTAGGSGGPGANTIEVTNIHDTAFLNATIIGNPGVGLTKAGAGTLVLGAANAFAGPITIKQGTLRLASAGVLGLCSTIDVGLGATLDVSAAPDYSLGADGQQTLEGAGAIVGNLRIDHFGTHDVGSSPGVQHIAGNYAMNGVLRVEVAGDSPGNGATGYDQVVVAGSPTFDVSLSGVLSLAWSGTGWSSAADRLWIVRNDTAGTLSGTFSDYGNGASVGNYDGREWNIYYGADADAGTFTGGNDVVLMRDARSRAGFVRAGDVLLRGDVGNASRAKEEAIPSGAAVGKTGPLSLWERVRVRAVWGRMAISRRVRKSALTPGAIACSQPEFGIRQYSRRLTAAGVSQISDDYFQSYATSPNYRQFDLSGGC